MRREAECYSAGLEARARHPASWGEERVRAAPASHVIGLTIAARRLAEATLEELSGMGVSVVIDDEGRARFRASQRTISPAAKRIIETHGDLLESYLKGGQDL